jgi:hypothetical protein
MKAETTKGRELKRHLGHTSRDYNSVVQHQWRFIRRDSASRSLLFNRVAYWWRIIFYLARYRKAGSSSLR